MMATKHISKLLNIHSILYEAIQNKEFNNVENTYASYSQKTHSGWDAFRGTLQ